MNTAVEKLAHQKVGRLNNCSAYPLTTSFKVMRIPFPFTLLPQTKMRNTISVFGCICSDCEHTW